MKHRHYICKIATTSLFAILIFPCFAFADVTVDAEEAIETKSDTTLESSPAPKRGPIRSTRSIAGAGVPEIKPLVKTSSMSTIAFVGLLLVGLGLYKKLRLDKPNQVSSDRIELAARRSIGPRTALLIVAADGKRFLLSQQGDDVSLIAALDKEPSFSDTISLFETDESESLTAAKKLVAC